MEHSMGKAVSDSANEESGWTSYLEDLSNSIEQQSYCSSLGGSSLLSDAASSAAWKLSHHNNHLLSYPSVRVKESSTNVSKKLRSKKIRTKQISDDDPLEDTASSPVNSPKVGGLKVSSKIDDQLDGCTSRGKGFNSERYPKPQTDECDINFNGNNVDCNTDLKKKGLCLVPLSMLVNYYG